MLWQYGTKCCHLLKLLSLRFFEPHIIFSASCALFTFTWLSLIFMLDKCKIWIILAWNPVGLTGESLRHVFLLCKACCVAEGGGRRRPWEDSKWEGRDKNRKAAHSACYKMHSVFPFYSQKLGCQVQLIASWNCDISIFVCWNIWLLWISQSLSSCRWRHWMLSWSWVWKVVGRHLTPELESNKMSAV